MKKIISGLALVFCVFFAVKAEAAISVVQHGGTSSALTSVSHEALTTGSNVATNDIMVVTCATFSTAPTNASDSVGDVYVLDATSSNPTNGPEFDYTYHAKIASGGGTKITVACNGANQQYFNISYAELSGVSTSTSVDKAIGAAVNPAANASFGVTLPTTSNANELIYGSCTPEHDIVGVSSGFTKMDETTDSLTDEYKLVSTTGNYSTGFTNTNRADNDSCTAASFNAVAAGSTTTSTPPQNLSATPGNAQVSLSWQAPASNGGSALTQYLVYDRFTGSSTFALYATTSPAQANATATSLVNGKSYDFEVIAQNGVGTSSPSNIVASTPTLPPPVINSFTATPAAILSGGTSTLSWNVSGALSSIVITPGSFASTSSVGTTVVVPTSTTVYTLTALNANASTTAQATVTVSTSSPQLPTTPTNLTVTALTAFTTSLSWSTSTDSAGVTGYQIFRNSVLVATSSVTSYWDDNLTPSSTYTYNVTAYDSAGNVSLQSSSTLAMTTALPSHLPAYPLAINTSTNSLVDQSGTPFFMVGEDVWALVTQVSNADVNTYLADRASRGFNTIWMAAADNVTQTNAPQDYYGAVPFDGPDFTNEDPTYWAHVDYVIQRANAYGITVMLDPAFVGSTSSDGYINSYLNSSDAVMTAYGAFIGNRYKNYSNVMWVLGGDADPNVSGLYTKLADLATGIKSVDPNQFITLEASRFTAQGQAPNGGYSSMDATMLAFGSVPSWLNLNWVYNGYDTVQTGCASNYARPNALPPLMGEDWYEGEHGMTPLTLREEGYWAALSGCSLGRIFGNNAIWTMGGPSDDMGATWQSQLGSSGSVSESSIGKLLESREFWKLVPDASNTVLTAGQQSGTTIATAARTSDGATIIVYIPTQRTVTINMAELTGTQANGWWFNPQTETSTLIGTFATTGSQNFTSPDTNDWVLVLDGNGVVDTQPPTAPTNLVITGATPTSTSFAWTASTDNVGVAGYQIRRNGIVIATTTATSYQDIAVPSSTAYAYSVAAYDAAGNVSPQSLWSFTIEWNSQ